MKGLSIFNSKSEGKGGAIDMKSNPNIFINSDFNCFYVVNTSTKTKKLLNLSVVSVENIECLVNEELMLNELASVVSELPTDLVPYEYGNIVELPPNSFFYFYTRLIDTDHKVKTERLINIVTEYVDK